MQIKARGFKELEAQLLKLGSKEGTKVLRRAMFTATKPIEDQSKANAAALPTGSGSLVKAIGRRFVTGTTGGIFSGLLPNLGGKFSVVIAAVRNSRVAIALHNLFYKRKRRGIFHGHFLEFGTVRSKRFQFLRPAIDARGAEAVSKLASELKRGIEQLLERK